MVHFFSPSLFFHQLIIFGCLLTLAMKLSASVAPNAYGGAYVNLDPSYPPHVSGANGYVDMYGRPHVAMTSVAPGEGQIPHPIDNGLAAAGTVGGVAAPTGSSAAWEATFDPSIARR